MGGLGHTVSRFAKNLKIYLDKAIKYKSDRLRGSRSNKRSLPPSNPEKKNKQISLQMFPWENARRNKQVSMGSVQ